MKHIKIKRMLSIALISCLVITGTPLQALAEEINESHQWQEILTTFEGDQNTNSLDTENKNSSSEKKDSKKEDRIQDEKHFSLDEANQEFKTDRFIVKYKDNVELDTVMEIPDLESDQEGQKLLNDIFDNINIKEKKDNKSSKLNEKTKEKVKESLQIDVDPAKLEDLKKKEDVHSARVIESKNLMILDTKDKMTAEELKNEVLKQDDEKQIEYIQPDYELGMSAVDPYLEEQWGHYQLYDPSVAENSLDSEEVDTQSPYRMDADVIEAWEKAKGDGVTIALLDTGIETTHVDLQGNLLAGWDFVNDDDSVNDAEWKYDQWHGTHIAGIIAAEEGNGIGVAGVAPEAKILPLKIFQSGTAYTSDIISAIEYAELCGAKIANCSWGTLYDNPALEAAIENSSMIFVCAAGNNLYDTDKYPVYPASYDLDNVISVTSIDQDGRLSRFANYGKESVDVAAPGRDIYSTTIDNGFAKNSGTSMSAGYVSGALALLLSKDLTKTAEELKSRLISSGDKITGLVDKVKNGKKLNCSYGLSINPLPNFNVIDVEDNDPLPEITPNSDGETEDDYDTYAENTVSIKTPMPTARYGLGVVAVGSKIYAIGGQTATECSIKVEEYDPESDTWTTKADMPTASSYFGIAKINDKIYVLGGYNGSYLNIVQVYNPATDTWTTQPASHNMPIAMKSFAATAYNGRIYVTGGYNGAYLNTIYEYTPATGTWAQKQSLSYNRGGHVSVEYGGKIYIDGGCTTNGGWFNVEEVYDPATNQVQQTGTSRIFTVNGAALNIGERYVLTGGQKADTGVYSNKITHRSLRHSDNTLCQAMNSMYYARAGLGAAEVNGKVYMIGGQGPGGILSVVEEVDLGWEIKGDLPAEMKNFTSIECNGKLYILGGETLESGQNVRIKTVYEYSPETNTWEQKADMPEYRVYFSAVVAYGKIYIIGGKHSSTNTGTFTTDNKVYEFDPAGNSWTEKTGISSARYNIASVNYNNSIYIVGGRNSTGNLVGNVEVFDPLAGTWQNKNNLPQVSEGHILTVSNSKLLLIGGTNSNVLEYNASQDSWSIKYSGLSWATFPCTNSIVELYGNVFLLSALNTGCTTPLIFKYDVVSNKTAYYASFYLFNRAFSTVTLNNKVYTFDGSGTYATRMIEYRPPVTPWLMQNNTGIMSRFMGTAVVGSDIYCLGGDIYDNSNGLVSVGNGRYKLDTQTNTWSNDGGIIYPRAEMAVGVVNGKICIAGGRDCLRYDSTNQYWVVYDSSTHELSLNGARPMPLPVIGAAGVGYNGQLYVFGGRIGENVYNKIYTFSPYTVRWSQVGVMPTARYGCSAALLSDGKIYVVGGYDRYNNPLSTVEAYDPVSRLWTTIPSMPEALAYPGVAGADSLYVVGGKGSNSVNGLVYEYRPETNRWFSWPGPPVALYGSSVAIANDGLYVINGVDAVNTTYDCVYYLPLGSQNADYIHLGEESINLSGNLARNYTDMSYTSQGFQLNFSRTYNSRDDRTEGNLISKGWTFGFQGKISSEGNDTLARLPNGSGYLFKENTDGTFTAKDSRSTLVKQTDDSYILTTKDLYSYGFNSSGYLTWMKDRNGNMISISVASDGKINYITDPAGRQTSIQYSSNRIWKITDFAGRAVTYNYDSNGNLSTVTDPMGNVTRYSYDSKGFLIGVKDHNENALESFTYFDIPSYETLPKIKTVTDAFGKTDTYQYDEGDGTVTITDNNDRQNITWYDKMLYPIRIRDAEGKETHIEYNLIDGINKYGEERVVIDRRGNATYYDRDENGNVFRQINPDGSIKEFGYDEKNNLTSEKDELGKQTFYVYDTDKINLLKKAQPLNGTDVYTEGGSEENFAVTSNTYYTDAEAQTMCGKVIHGLLKTVTDPVGNVTTYTYNTYGNIATIKNGLNETATYQYNPVGWLKQETSEKGYTTTYYYDRNGNVIKKIQHGGETERMIYDHNGHIVQNIKPKQYASANDTASTYNANNILTNANSYGVSGDGYRYVYYPSGQLQTETDPLNAVTSYTYDQYGNALTKTYDNGYAEVYTYDVLNRNQSISYQNSSASAIVLTDEYSYHITNDGYFEKTCTHHFNSANAPETAVSKETYDYADRLVRTDYADGSYSTNEYAANGTLSIATDSMGNAVYYTYDGLNREVGKWSSVSEGLCDYEGKEYFKNGNVRKQIASRATVASYSVPTSGLIYMTFLYDAIGRVTEQGDSQGGKSTYAYDDTADKVTQRQYTSASEYVETEMQYNHLGKVKETDLKVNSADMKNGESVLTTIYTYDEEGNPRTETAPNNVVTTYGHDFLGRKISQSEPSSDENAQTTTSAISYTYDFRGNVLTETDPLGRITSYDYTPNGLLEKKTDPKGGVTYTERTQDNLIVSQVSPKNYVNGSGMDQMTRTTYQYDVMGRAVHENSIYKGLDDVFRTITKDYTYDHNGNMLTSEDGMGYVTAYTYDGQNRQLTILDPESNDNGLSFTTKDTYDGLGQKISEENGIHAVTSYTYNDQGRVLTVAVDGVTTKSCTYDLAGNLLSESDGNANATSYTYNALGKVNTKTLSGDSSIGADTISYLYTNTGDIASSVDTLGKKNEFTYDNQHRLLSETESKTDGTNSITKSYRYDIAGNLRFSVDGKGNTTEFTYNEMNRKTSQTVTVTINGTTSTQTTSYAYDADGKLTATTDWLGNESVNVYDSLDRLVSKIAPSGNLIEKLTYDDNHRQIGSEDALQHVVTFAYDKANRLISTTDASGHTESKAYDAVGNIVTSTDGEGNVTTYQYDVNNRLQTVTNALQETTSYMYDNAGNLLIQTDGNENTTTYQYNVRNLPTARIDAGGVISGGGINVEKAESYQYYADGNLSVKTDRNGVISTYTYDIHGRLLSEDAGGEIVSYTYDNNNNQLTMQDATGMTTRVYDELGRVTSKTVPTVGTTIFTYDQTAGLPAGYVSESYLDPKGNTVVKINDKDGRLYQVKNGTDTTTYSYYANGTLQKLEYPNGSSEEYTYYANNKLHTLVNKQGFDTIEAFSYAYDGAGNMTGKADRKGATSYTYDDLNRLQTVTEPTGKITAYQYDEAGNRTSETITEGSDITRTEYTYNEQNRLTGTTSLLNSDTTGGEEYSFDNNGNVLSVLPYALTDAVTSSAMTIDLSVLGNPEIQNVTGAAIYEYDNRNQMVKAVEGAYTVASEYNGDGLRVSKTVNGETSNYLYEYDKIILETDGDNAETAQNIYGTNLIKRSAGSDSLFYLYNGHGDVVSLQTPDGITAAQYYYDAFGTATEETAAVNNPFRYAGYEYDNETELYYLKARMYDSVNARFMQEDTYRGEQNDPLSLNLYAYCSNNPLVYWDPTGHLTIGTINIANGVSGVTIGSGVSVGTVNMGAGSSLTNNGTIGSLNTGSSGHHHHRKNSTVIENSGYIGEIHTGSNSANTIINNGNIDYINTGRRSTNDISNNSNSIIGAINTGSFSITVIINYATIGNVDPGMGSSGCISNITKSTNEVMSSSWSYSEYDLYANLITDFFQYKPSRDIAGEVYCAWLDTRPDKRIPILKNPSNTFCAGTELYQRLSYLYNREHIDITKLTTKQIDEIYEVEHYDKIGMIAAGVDAAAVISANIARGTITLKNVLINSSDDVAEGAGNSVGAARRLTYEASPKHGSTARGSISAAPRNGQEALDLSIQVKPTSPRRVGIDYKTGEFNVFDQTSSGVFHGHVRTWDQLTPEMQRALKQAGMVDSRGRILGGQ